MDIDSQTNSAATTTAAKTGSTNIDTVGTYMVPAKDLVKDVAVLTNAGVCYNMHRLTNLIILMTLSTKPTIVWT